MELLNGEEVLIGAFSVPPPTGGADISRISHDDDGKLNKSPGKLVSFWDLFHHHSSPNSSFIVTTPSPEDYNEVVGPWMKKHVELDSLFYLRSPWLQLWSFFSPITTWTGISTVLMRSCPLGSLQELD
jgi:hypothetical protein